MQKVARFLVNNIFAPAGTASALSLAMNIALLPFSLPFYLSIGQAWVLGVGIGISFSLCFGLLIACCLINFTIG